MTDLILYQFPISHYCEKVRWALEHKNIPHTKRSVLPGMHVKKMLKLTGQSSVPVIQHNNLNLHNSAKILDYLDEQFPEQSLTPINAEDAKAAKEWETFADNNLGPQVRVFMYHYLLEEPNIVIPFFTNGGPFYGRFLIKAIFPKLNFKMRKWMKINAKSAILAKKQILNSLEKINTRLQGRKFLAGDSFSRADLAVAALLAPLFMPTGYGLDVPQLPAALQKQLDEFEPHLEWVRSIYSNYR